MVGWPRNHAGVREVTHDNSKSLVSSSSTAKLLRSLKRIDRPLTQVQEVVKVCAPASPRDKVNLSLPAFPPNRIAQYWGGPPSGICPGTMGRMESNRRIWAVCGTSYGSGTM
jgi:hypothetical protein